MRIAGKPTASLSQGVDLLALFVIYVCTARLGLMVGAVGGFATLFWPPTGIALAALLRYGARLWPSIALGAFLVNWSIGAPWLTACGTALGNTLEAVVGAYVLRRVIRFDMRLARLRDVLGLVGVAAPIGAFISATIGVSSLWFGHVITANAYAATWRAWWVGDMLGALTFAPLFLTWSTPPMTRRPAGLVEVGLLAIVLAGVGELIFGRSLPAFSEFPLSYLIFPPLIWAAVRVGPRGAATCTGLLAMLAIGHTVQGDGLFSRGTVSESLFSLQLFMAVVIVTILMVAAIVAERICAEHAAQDSREALRRVHEALETTVQQRTAALASTNEALRDEIDHHQRIEEALNRTATELSFLNNLVEQTTQPLAVADLEGRLVRFNRAFQELTGYAAEELRVMRFQQLTPEYGQADEQQQVARLVETGHALRYEQAFLRKDGTLVPLELVVDLYRNAQHRPEFVYAFVTEITERKRTQEQLQRTNELLVQQQQQLIEAMVKLEQANKELQATQLQLIQSAKLESVGRLAAGVAHEVKNPLATLLIGIDHLSDHFSISDQSVGLLLQDMRDAVRRADGVIRELLDFSSPETLELTEADLTTMIERAFVLVKHEVDRRKVAVVRRLAGDLPRVSVDRHKVQQVFVNLFMNAVQAMPSGGTLTITTSLRRLDVPVDGVGIRQTDGFRLGESVVVAEIEDTGIGIPPDKLHKIFDPFFTTKPSGLGTGLGLTVTKKIVELHGGLITAKNRPEGGVNMIVMFHTERAWGHGHATEAKACAARG